jgi:hypothetical protein
MGILDDIGDLFSTTHTVVGTGPVDTDGDGTHDVRDADDDDDGLDDQQETYWGTNPTSHDSDGDGLWDGDEVGYYGTDPTDADTDHDGVRDGLETEVYGTDPLRSDTDRDGLGDHDELFLHHTNPNVADTDRDGATDGIEVHEFGSDPNVFDQMQLESQVDTTLIATPSPFAMAEDLRHGDLAAPSLAGVATGDDLAVVSEGTAPADEPPLSLGNSRYEAQREAQGAGALPDEGPDEAASGALDGSETYVEGGGLGATSQSDLAQVSGASASGASGAADPSGFDDATAATADGPGAVDPHAVARELADESTSEGVDESLMRADAADDATTDAGSAFGVADGRTSADPASCVEVVELPVVEPDPGAVAIVEPEPALGAVVAADDPGLADDAFVDESGGFADVLFD